MKKKSRARHTPRDNESKPGLDRRSFVKLLPAVGAAGLAAPYIGSAATEQQPQQQQPQQRISKEALHAAGTLIGIELTDEQETMALPSVNNNLASYEAIRKIEVPLDTEPAIAFHPALPGKKFNFK